MVDLDWDGNLQVLFIFMGGSSGIEVLYRVSVLTETQKIMSYLER